MKIWTSAQKAVEKRVELYINQLIRADEKEHLEHMAQCGSILRDNTAEIETYLAYKKPNKKEVSVPTDPAANI